MKYQLNLLILSFFFSSVSYGQLTDRRIGRPDANISDICFTKFGSKIAVPDSLEIDIYKTSTQKQEIRLTGGHTRRILAVDISADSSMLVSGGCDSLIVVWNLKTNQIITKKKEQKGVITSVKFSPDGKYFAAGCSDNSVFIYSTSSDSIILRDRSHTKDITAVCFSPDGKQLATSSGDRLIHLLETTHWTQIAILKGHYNWVRDIRFSWDGAKLYSCGDDSNVITWYISDLKNRIAKTEVVRGFKWLLTVDASPFSDAFVCGGLQRNVWLDLPPNRFRFHNESQTLKIRFLPNSGPNYIYAIATRGNGVLLVDTKYINLDEYLIHESN